MYKRHSSTSVNFIVSLTLALLLSAVPFGRIYAADSGDGLKLLKSLNEAFVEVAKEIDPVVVNISTTSVLKPTSESKSQPRQEPFWDPFRDFFGDDFFKRFFQEPQERTQKSLGSGVIVDKNGYILTNNHVVAGLEGADTKVKVILEDKREFDAKIIGRDPDTDVAVIKIEAKDLPAAKLGSSDNIRVGEWVLAVGNPFALSHTVTAGIVSAVGRSNVNIATYEDFIQTDAAINPGNSGGPLVNIDGEVIGINTAIATASGMPGNVGVGFAIPINMALEVMNQLKEKGRVSRGWLGVSIQDISKDIAEKYGLKEPKGALVSAVGGPAQEAGLKPGDLIVEFDGKPVKDSTHLKNMVAEMSPNKTVKLKVIRDGKEEDFEVKLGERTENALAELGGKEAPGAEGKEKWMGLSTQELTDELAQKLGYQGQKGVLITEVDPTGPAAQVDNPPRQGDLIQEIERQEIRNMDDYRKAIDKVKDLESVLVRLRRSTGQTWYIVLKK